MPYRRGVFESSRRQYHKRVHPSDNYGRGRTCLQQCSGLAGFQHSRERGTSPRPFADRLSNLPLKHRTAWRNSLQCAGHGMHLRMPASIIDLTKTRERNDQSWHVLKPAALQANLEQLPDLLLSYSETEIRSMQISLSHIWHRFAYTSIPMYQQANSRLNYVIDN